MGKWLAAKGFPVATLHGDLSQGAREHAIQRFRAAEARVLVATDVAARGLDVPNVSAVINFSLGGSIDHYVHRVGRCGRAGRTGVAHTFIVDGDESLAAPLVKLLEHNRQVVPPELIELVRATERAEQAACAREIEGVDELEEEEEALLLEQRKANRERQRQHYKERMAKEKKQQNRMYRRH